MTVNDSIMYARRISDLQLLHCWTDRQANLAAVAGLLVRLNANAADQIVRVLLRYGAWRYSAFLRICEGATKGASFEALCASYAAAECWDHNKGAFVLLGKQSCECCKKLLKEAV